jgi:hypothetical protein
MDKEIQKILENHEKRISALEGIKEKPKLLHKKKVSITQLILELKSDGFFNKSKNWNDIQKALEERGHVYPLRSLTEPLQRLVRKRELGRIKIGKKWGYVKR